MFFAAAVDVVVAAAAAAGVVADVADLKGVTSGRVGPLLSSL